MKGFFFVILGLFISACNAQTHSIIDQIKNDWPYEPSDGVHIGLGLIVEKQICGLLFSTQAGHIDFGSSITLSSDDTKAYGCFGESYTSVMGNRGFSWNQYIGRARSTTNEYCFYLGYCFSRFVVGGCMGWSGYHTGETYYDQYHILSSDGYYTVAEGYSTELVYGVYGKFLLWPYANIVFKYTNTGGFGIGVLFTIGIEM